MKIGRGIGWAALGVVLGILVLLSVVGVGGMLITYWLFVNVWK